MAHKVSRLKNSNMKLKLSVIGCGRLGKTLAFLLAKTELVCVQDVVNLNRVSAEKAVAFIGQGRVCASIKQLHPADVYLIATPDDSIELVSQQLAKQILISKADVVFHCSGLLSSECLNSLAQLGCYTASIHPIFSFSKPIVDIEVFKGTYCAFEGNKLALEKLLPLFRAIDSQLFLIEKNHKTLYHTASVLASNYLVTLASMAEVCYKKAGLSSKLAKTLTQALMAQTLSKIQCLDKPSAALTGPLQRGDSNTLKKHLQALKPFSDLACVYKSLARATLPLTQHDACLKEALALLFMGDAI
jgi:predicted short-subunit dehydrogenase-like oxidoreductase (DUF2520 family)